MRNWKIVGVSIASLKELTVPRGNYPHETTWEDGPFKDGVWLVLWADNIPARSVRCRYFFKQDGDDVVLGAHWVVFRRDSRYPQEEHLQWADGFDATVTAWLTAMGAIHQED